MAQTAEKGKDPTREMVAKIGQSSRLGERSGGTLDAGATSCCLNPDSMGKSTAGLLE